ncbi:MAG: leucine-rich repeat protein [Clostridia bacterium]|nr:leucine-rich repeat protein [Clostridia bacterium]
MFTFMKKILYLAAVCFALIMLCAQAEEIKNTTVMVYMCGSNLESINGSAGTDIYEMLEAEYNKDEIQVVLMTGGSEKWIDIAVDPETTGVYEITSRSSLRRRWNEDLLNMGASETLSFFLDYAYEKYPAERYALILWNHGGGPLSGICWDEISSDHLTLDEVTKALSESPFQNQMLEWIGFDACLMASAEVAWQMAPYARYMIASEELEPVYGWDYSFLKGLEADEDGAATGKRIIEGYMASRQDDDKLTLSLIDLSKIDDLRASLSQYYDFLEKSLTAGTFSQHSRVRSTSEAFGSILTRAVSDKVSGDYDLVDLGHMLKQNTTDNWMKKEALDALEKCVVLSASTEEEHHGLSVYFPLYNKKNYALKWKNDYSKLNFSDGYTGYVEKFGQILLEKPLADWSEMEIQTELLGETDADGVRLTLQLTPEQQANFASARVLALGMEEFNTYYRTYYSEDIALSEDGTLSAQYHWETLHAANDADGHIMTPSLDFYVTEDGTYALYAVARKDLEEGGDGDMPILLTYKRAPGENTLTPDTVYVWDEQTQNYTNRLSINLDDYAYLYFVRTYRTNSSGYEGFDSWPVNDRIQAGYPVSTKESFHLAFISDSYDDPQVFFEITDTQNNTYLSQGRSRRSRTYNDYLVDNIVMEISSDALMVDESGVYLSLRTTNRYARVRDDQKNRLYFFSPEINGIPTAFSEGNYTLWETEPESVNVKLIHIKWPEGVNTENAESFSFRALTCFYDDAAIQEGDDPASWNATEYAVFSWDRSLTENHSAVSMNPKHFTIDTSLSFAKIDYVENFEQEAIDYKILGNAPERLIVPLPEEVRGAKSGYAIVSHITTNADGAKVNQPLWILKIDSETNALSIPNACFTLESDSYSLTVPAFLNTDGSTGSFAGGIDYHLGEDLGEIKANKINFDLSRMQLTSLQLSGSPFPIGMTNTITPYTILPDFKGYKQEAPIENAILPLKTSITGYLPDDSIIMYIYTNSDGTSRTYPAEYLLFAISDVADAPAEDAYASAPNIVLDEYGFRQIAYGDFVIDTSGGDCAIVAYYGKEESVVFPDSIQGHSIDRIRIQNENPHVRTVTLPASLQTANYGSDRYPEVHAMCGFSGFTNLETIIVPEAEHLMEVPIENFFLTSTVVPYTYGTVTHVVRGEEEKYFSKGFLYELDADGSATILDALRTRSEYFGEEELIIPSQLNGHPVKRIAYRAFYFESRFLRVTIENGMESIGEEAFAHSDIQSISFPESILFIDESAFTSSDLNTAYTVGKNADLIRSYFDGTRITVLELPSTSGAEGLFTYETDSAGKATITGLHPGLSVKDGFLTVPSEIAGYPVYKIGSGAFQSLDLKTVLIEEGILEIGKEAFRSNNSLVSVTLPSTLLRIDEYAFIHCGSLCELRLPDSLESMAENALIGSGITKLYFNHLPNGVRFNEFYDKFDVLVCPKTLWGVIDKHFMNQTLARVYYEEGSEQKRDGFIYVISEGRAAILSGPLNKDEIVIPDQLGGYPVQVIASYAFESSNAHSISFPKSLSSIGYKAFYGNEKLLKVYLPDSVVSVGSEAFRNCISLQAIRISASMVRIPDSMLDGCKALAYAYLPNSIRDIGTSAFGLCWSLERITLPEGLENIESLAFSHSGLKTIVLPASLRTIDSYAFSGELEKAYLLSHDAAIHTKAFDDTVEILYVSEYPEEELINEPAVFFPEEEESEETLPAETATSGSCGEGVLWELDENGALKISGSGKMDDYKYSQFFPSFAPWYEIRDKIVSVEIEKGVQSIGDSAFSDLSLLRHVSLPDGLESIGSGAFLDCSSIREIVIPQSVSEMGSLVFSGCTALESVSLPRNLESIKYLSFRDCVNLTHIELPASLKIVEEYAFEGCTGLTSIVVPDGTETIYGYAFVGCINVTLIDIPSSVTFIGPDIFADEELADPGSMIFSNSPNYEYLLLIVDEDSAAHKYAKLYDLNYKLR